MLYEVITSAGGVVDAARRVFEGEIDNAFCAVRPPGHHACPDRAMGFCYFNNIALAAYYLQSKCKIRRVAIVDFDVHHGNGTQAIFDGDPRITSYNVCYTKLLRIDRMIKMLNYHGISAYCDSLLPSIIEKGEAAVGPLVRTLSENYAKIDSYNFV